MFHKKILPCTLLLSLLSGHVYSAEKENIHLISSDEVPGVSVPEGSLLKVEADFAKHKLKSPTALTFDDQGSVYVSETHRFRFGVEDNRMSLFWYLDDLAAQTTADRRKLHEKWQSKVSMKHMTSESELVRKLSDSDGDGSLDKSQVFSDEYRDVLDGTAAGVFYYDGALYFACIPKIYMLNDADGDGDAEGKKVVEEGFGVRVSISGHDLNGFALGPDGRIYGTVGDRGYSLTTKEGRMYHFPNEGAAFRFEPDGTGFEIMHTGLRNPKEIIFNEYGDAFTVDNNSDQGDEARVVYLVEGADSGWQQEHQTMHNFHRQIGLETRPPNRWMNEKIWQMQDSEQPAYFLPPVAYLGNGPSGMTYHPGAGFLESEKGRFLLCDYRGSAGSQIWSFQMQPKGAGMKLVDPRVFLKGVAVTDVDYSWDGRVFITDFIDGWESHNAGRLLSLRAENAPMQQAESEQVAKIISEGFDHRDSDSLAKLLSHPDQRIRLRAQIALTRKTDAVNQFKKATESANELEKIHGIWGLGIVARRGSVPKPFSKFSSLVKKSDRDKAVEIIVALMKDTNPEIRTQALRAISEVPISGDRLPLGILLSDESPRVRFAAAIAIGKMKSLGNYSSIIPFIMKNNDRDTYLRHAGIFALQHICNDPRQISALATEESAALRLSAVVALRRLKSEEVIRFLNDPEPKVQDEVIRAIQDLDMTELRPMLSPLLDDLSKREWSEFMLRRLIHNAYRVGSLENAKRLLAIIGKKDLPKSVRAEALRLISIWERPFPADQLSGHWRPLEPRPLSSLIPALEEALPVLLESQDFVLTGALELIKQYKIETPALDAAKLISMVDAVKLPADARSMALSLAIQIDISDLNSLLARHAADASDDLAFTAMDEWMKRDLKAALPAVKQAASSQEVSRSQKAWKRLANIPGEEMASWIISQLSELVKTKGVSPYAIELIAAAESRKEPKVMTALKKFQDAISKDSDPLAQFNISLLGGDAERGAALFESHPTGQCKRCHLAGEQGHGGGAMVGPNLSGVGAKYDARYLLEALILPGAAVAPGYGIVGIQLKNGASLGGTLLAETPEYLDIATTEEDYRVMRTDIASFTPSVSAMPPMGSMMKPSEIRDVVAWLASLDEELKSSKRKAPLALNPDNLLKK